MKEELTRIRKMLTLLDTNQAHDFFLEAQAIFRPTLLDLGCPEELITYTDSIAYNHNPKSSLNIHENSTSSWCEYDTALEHPLAEVYSATDLVIGQSLPQDIGNFRLSCSFSLWFTLSEETKATLWQLGKLRMEPGHASTPYATLACDY